MKRLLIIVLLCTVLSCAKDPQAYVEFVDGYWEIDEVTMSNGLKKKYNFNATIDFIQLTDSLSGVRRKLKPNLKGKFESSQSVESFRIKIENDSLNVYYTTPYANWKETILEASQTHLLVVNTNKDVYLYKRYEPLDVD